MPAIVGQDFKRGALVCGEHLGHASLIGSPVSQRQFARGKLGVEAVLDAARRIAVAQTDKGFSGRRDSTFHADMRRF